MLPIPRYLAASLFECVDVIGGFPSRHGDFDRLLVRVELSCCLDESLSMEKGIIPSRFLGGAEVRFPVSTRGVSRMDYRKCNGDHCGHAKNFGGHNNPTPCPGGGSHDYHD